MSGRLPPKQYFAARSKLQKAGKWDPNRRGTKRPAEPTEDDEQPGTSGASKQPGTDGRSGRESDVLLHVRDTEGQTTPPQDTPRPATATTDSPWGEMSDAELISIIIGDYDPDKVVAPTAPGVESAYHPRGRGNASPPYNILDAGSDDDATRLDGSERSGKDMGSRSPTTAAASIGNAWKHAASCRAVVGSSSGDQSTRYLVCNTITTPEEPTLQTQNEFCMLEALSGVMDDQCTCKAVEIMNKAANEWIAVRESNPTGTPHWHFMLITCQRSDNVRRNISKVYPEVKLFKLQKVRNLPVMLEYIMKAAQEVSASEQKWLNLAAKAADHERQNKLPPSAQITSDIIGAMQQCKEKTLKGLMQKRPEVIIKHLHRHNLKGIIEQCALFLSQTGEQERDLTSHLEEFQEMGPIAEVLTYQGISLKRFTRAVWEWITKSHDKKNTLVLQGPSNTGKSAFIRPLALLYKTKIAHNEGQFSYTGCKDADIILWEEPIIFSGNIDMCKLVFEGVPTNVPQKYQSPIELPKTPVLITCNRNLYEYASCEQEPIMNRVWKFSFDRKPPAKPGTSCWRSPPKRRCSIPECSKNHRDSAARGGTNSTCKPSCLCTCHRTSDNQRGGSSSSLHTTDSGPGTSNLQSTSTEHTNFSTGGPGTDGNGDRRNCSSPIDERPTGRHSVCTTADGGNLGDDQPCDPTDRRSDTSHQRGINLTDLCGGLHGLDKQFSIGPVPRVRGHPRGSTQSATRSESSGCRHTSSILQGLAKSKANKAPSTYGQVCPIITKDDWLQCLGYCKWYFNNVDNIPIQ